MSLDEKKTETHKWSVAQGQEMVNFGGQASKSHSHTRPNIDLEVWWRCHSLDPFGSSSFSSFIVVGCRYKEGHC